jgi:hypothetical protein
MGESRSVEAVRATSGGTTRRGALRGLGAVALGALVGALLGERAARAFPGNPGFPGNPELPDHHDHPCPDDGGISDAGDDSEGAEDPGDVGR